MTKIKTTGEYREKLMELHKRGRKATPEAGERQKVLEGETADYAQHLRAKETKGRPRRGKI
jgi:hypothetical protein